MKKIFTIAAPALVALTVFFAASCASTEPTLGGGAVEQIVGGLTLLEAIELAAEGLATGLPHGTRMAVVAFESESDRLSDFIMDELAAALIGHGIEVADRQNLELVSRELDFQMTGAVSDETAMSVGRFLGAEVVITGQLLNLGAVRRLSANAIHVETATRVSAPRFDVQNNVALQNMIAALGGRPVQTAPAVQQPAAGTQGAPQPVTAAVGGAREAVPAVGVSSSVSMGRQHTVAITGGALWAWGSNWAGQLGDGTTGNRNAPVRIGTEANWSYVSAGNSHTVAIRTDGTLWTWGSNMNGRTGHGMIAGNTLAPAQVGTATNWVSVSAGDAHTVAVRADGTLWAWGSNEGNRLGDGTSTHRNTPTRIGSDANWVTASAGGAHTLAIRTDGSLWAWGNNLSSQLGVDEGRRNFHSTPTHIQPGTTWASVSAGVSITVAIKTDGSLWAWGNNDGGGTGRGSLAGNTRIPTRIGGDYGWVSVSAGNNRAAATKADGSLWNWGNRALPHRIAPTTRWAFVSIDQDIAAIGEDGSVWAFGGVVSGARASRNNPTRVALR